MLDWTQCSAVERAEGKVSGAWLFRGTRVPVKALFENIEDGATVENFLGVVSGREARAGAGSAGVYGTQSGSRLSAFLQRENSL